MPILVPTDFSNPSLEALERAIDLARRMKAELVVLHVIEPVYYAGVGDVPGVGYDTGLVYQELERAGRAQLARIGARLRTRRLRARTLLAFGTAHQTIDGTARS
jgi:universal stress protein A